MTRSSRLSLQWRLIWLALLVALSNLAAPDVAYAQSAPAPYLSAVRYDAMGRTTGTIAPDPDGAGPLHFAAVRNTFDQAGRLIKVEQGELVAWQSESIAPSSWTGFTVLSSVETAYDQVGRKVRETVRGSDNIAVSLTQYSYDLAGRLTCTAVRMNPAIYANLPSSACTPGAEGANGPDRISRTVSDAAGQVLQRRVGVGSSVEAADVTYAYNLNGQITSVIDSEGNRADYRYDGHGRQDRWSFPSPVRPTAYNDTTPALALASAGVVNAADYEQYGYDPNGNRISLRKRDGSTITIQYDAANRPRVRTIPERAGLAAVHTRDVYLGYDLRGLQTRAAFASITGEGVSTSYDGFGRIVANTSSMGGVTRTLTMVRDRNGNRTQLNWMDGLATSYAWDGANRLSTIFEGALGSTVSLVSYAYNNRQLPASTTTRFGVTTAMSYDGVSRLSGLAFDAASTPQDVNWTIARNAAGQTIETTRSNDLYAYTGGGNLNQSYTSNGLNQYSVVGAASLTHDANGNLTSDGTTTYLYDVENRLVSAVGARNATLTYDPLGRLWEIVVPNKTIRIVYDGDEAVAEYDGTGVLVARYVHGASVDDPVVMYAGTGFGTAYWLHADMLDSITGVSDATGAIVSVNRYDEYGVTPSSNFGRFQYTGQMWIPQLGLYYYKARFYNPALGRFMQTDPIGYDDQINLYAYVGNDPVNATDPSGNQSVQDMQLDAQIDDMRRQGMSEREILRRVGDDAETELVALSIFVPAEAIVLRGLGWAPRAIQAFRSYIGSRSTSAAYRAAAAGGENSGHLATLLRTTNAGVQRSLRRNLATIAEHAEKIANPSRFMRRGDPLNPADVEHAISAWQRTINRAERQAAIARDELRRRGVQ